MAHRDFTLDDFRKQIDQFKNVGAVTDMLRSMPGMEEMLPDGEDPAVSLKRIEDMIDAMSEEERQDPEIIDQARIARIAEDSGTEAHEVQQFLGQFYQLRKLMQRISSMSIWQRIKLVTGFGKIDFSDD